MPAPLSFTRLSAAVFAVLAAVLAAGCADRAPAEPLPFAQLRAEWETAVARKDSLFRSAGTPLLPADTAAFDGLPHFPYDTTFVFAPRLTPTFTTDTLLLTTSTGTARPFTHAGLLSFTYDDRPFQLTAFRPALLGPPTLFIPFRDASSGRATYGAGRYLELQEQPDGRYLLDFNFATTPYCAFNPQYVCPLPPAENLLPFEVLAGERVTGSLDIAG
ncbi:MAG: DUF1684 domain-containing protein [Bacteroidota bacterium]